MCYEGKPAISIYFVLLLGLCLGGCELSKFTKSSEQKVLIFRQQIKQRDYDAVLRSASSAFNRNLSDEKRNVFVEKMESFGSEIGEDKNFQLVNVGMSKDILGETLITLTYKPRINGGVASEEYVFVLENGNCLLFNYKFDERQ
ncbi:MAG: hypothetical protein ACKVRN_02700 [Pyrinomonadaceae bacterium]